MHTEANCSAPPDDNQQIIGGTAKTLQTALKKKIQWIIVNAHELGKQHLAPNFC